MIERSGATYRDEIRSAIDDGFRFAGLHASGRDRILVLLTGEDGAPRLVTGLVDHGTLPTIVDLVPAAGWDEREAHDLHGIVFDGHDPLRPLLDHDAAPQAWMVPVHGADTHEVAVGPIHAGVIESGHFRFHVVGDRILLVDVRLHHKRRGLEEAAVGSTLADGLPYAGRACAACHVSNTVAYAGACEALMGLEIPRELARVRTIMLELERLWSHLNDVGAMCAGVGMAAGTQRFAALTEDARRLNERLAGHRFLFGSIAVGGSDLDLDAVAIASAREGLSEIRASGSRAWRELLFNASFMDRMPQIGVVTAEEAATLGVVGPAARAAGLAQDVRTTSPRLAYSGFAPALLRRTEGDVQSRLEQRALELVQCLDILDDLLDRPVRPATARAGAAPAEIGVGRVESPRGATSCVVERAGERIARLRLRTGSYANWPAVAHAAAGNLLPDFPLINKSFELCYACVDR